MVKMIINRFKDTKNELIIRHNNRYEIFKEYGEYLKNGNYKINRTNKFCFWNGSKNARNFLKNPKNVFKGQSIYRKTRNSFFVINFLHRIVIYPIKLMALRLIDVYVISKYNGYEVNTETKKFHGDLLMILNEGDHIKIFDFDQNEVVTLFKNEKKFNNSVKVNEIIGRSFDTLIKDVDKKEKIIIEDIANYKALPDWSEAETLQIVKELLNNFVSFSNHLDEDSLSTQTTKDILQSFEKLTLDESMKRDILVGLLDNHLYDSWPVIHFAGDFQFKNMLYTNDGIKNIDFEYLYTGSFLNVIMSILFQNLVHESKIFVLEAYFEGQFDVELNLIFEHFSRNFYEQNKDYYVTLYILSLLHTSEDAFYKLWTMVYPLIKHYRTLSSINPL